MANILKVTNRHDWIDRPLPGLPGAHELKKQGLVKWGQHCFNCRMAWDPDDGSPPVDGCSSGVKVANMGRARQDDHVRLENRALAEQARREQDEERRLA